MNILLTGASGFIGANLSSKIESNFNLIKLDRKIDDLTCFINQDIHCLIHCASATPANTGDSTLVLEDNIAYAKKLAILVRDKKIPLLIYLSSMSVYGEKASGTLSEESNMAEPTLYGISKYATERIFSNLLNNESCKKVFLRLPGVVGLRAKDIFLAKLRDGFEFSNKVTVFNPFQLFNNVLHVNTLVQFVIHIINSKNQDNNYII
jgi:nucleoside-diphosphate-sugar epimerase